MSNVRHGIAICLLTLALALAETGTASGVTLTAGDAAGPPGGTVVVAVSLENEVPVRAVQLRLADTPNALTLVAGSARTTERSTGLVADANEQQDGSVIAVLISTGSALIAAGSGPVIEMDFTIAPSAPVGETIALGLSDVLVADPNSVALPSETENGGVVVALATPTPTGTSTEPPVPTPTFTHAATVTPSLTHTWTATSTATPTDTPSPRGSPTTGATATPTVGCVGDCDGDGRVTVDELIKGVNIALGAAPLTTCPAFDANDSQTVTVDELVTAVNLALNGCES